MRKHVCTNSLQVASSVIVLTYSHSQRVTKYSVNIFVWTLISLSLSLSLSFPSSQKSIQLTSFQILTLTGKVTGQGCQRSSRESPWRWRIAIETPAPEWQWSAGCSWYWGLVEWGQLRKTEDCFFRLILINWWTISIDWLQYTTVACCQGNG